MLSLLDQYLYLLFSCDTEMLSDPEYPGFFHGVGIGFSFLIFHRRGQAGLQELPWFL